MGRGCSPTIAELQEAVRRFRDERDWEQFHTLKDLAAAIAVEASELLELFLWMTVEQEPERLEMRRAEIAAELADVLILVLNFAEKSGIDAADAVVEKLKANAARYPVESARGSAAKYSDTPGG